MSGIREDLELRVVKVNIMRLTVLLFVIIVSLTSFSVSAYADTTPHKKTSITCAIRPGMSGKIDVFKYVNNPIEAVEK